ncbi:glutamate-cysteine ligase family protein [Streptomyces sp. NPDC090741]|uniref:glutamate-cysteine ligase family protein n=1 Tax=Streptomyces sp. NPDC090741 TaxID=3365967 RepID=UPI0037F283DC
MAEAAAGEGCLLVATGTPVIPPERPPTVTPGERYGRMAARRPSLVGSYDGMVCRCHIHVGVTGRGQALALANHVRPWLPTLQALAANSPSPWVATPAGPAGGQWSTPSGPAWGPPPCSTKLAMSAPPTTCCVPAPCWTAG